MEIELLEKEKDSIKVRIIGADMTLITPLVQGLLEDKDVAEVKYTIGHSQMEDPTLYIRVKTGKPQSALKKTAKALTNEFKEAREALQKDLK
ncbi:MAG: DNA-directed RNA polymerase subunit L [Methanomassiliicoccales archaeon PtaB.Bin134]|jgi:DNA-directed RNA polymerase subunit L|nr:MAG: DNA-directed RNA polymerase subunit L [Methanomassiliicoccales archaeon PtaB.Bin134]